MRLKEIERFTVIHCDTRDKVAEIFKKAKESDFPVDIWDRHKENTCVRVCDGVVVGYDRIDYYIEKGYKITEFSDLIIPELSAKEVLETLHDMCSFYSSKGGQCSDCPADPYCVSMSFKDGMDSFLDACTKWREEHPKEEKKELETEWVYVVRIIKVHDNGKKECVHEVVCNIEFSDMDKVAEAELKHYRSEHEGNFFAVYEHICRIKE